ncbi:hypothetical protein EV401DRAFT_1946847, partial [Pisolithus croceorrhizus]
TPNPYTSDGGKTSAWNAASRTPNPYADGGKTPAWNASSRTPNPYGSNNGGTAWSANGGSRTPRPRWGGGRWDTGHAGWGNASPAWPAETETWVHSWRLEQCVNPTANWHHGLRTPECWHAFCPNTCARRR